MVFLTEEGVRKEGKCFERCRLVVDRRVAHRENALFALVRDIRGDIHQKYNAQYRGDIHEYRAISRNIAWEMNIAAIFMNIAAIFMNIAAIFMNNAQYRIDAFSISMVRSGQIVGSIHIHISPNKRRGRLFTQQPLMGGRLFNFLQKSWIQYRLPSLENQFLSILSNIHKVPWCNGKHSGLWIRRSGFKSW